jgi:putative transposase
MTSNEPVISARRRYPSDLSERQWSVIAPLVPPERTLGRPRTCPVREIINAINYRWETGCTWRMLPHDYPPWPTVYTYFRQWRRTGVLRQLREAIVRPLRSSPQGAAQPVNAAPGRPAAERVNAGFTDPTRPATTEPATVSPPAAATPPAA